MLGDIIFGRDEQWQPRGRVINIDTVRDLIEMLGADDWTVALEVRPGAYEEQVRPVSVDDLPSLSARDLQRLMIRATSPYLVNDKDPALVQFSIGDGVQTVIEFIPGAGEVRDRAQRASSILRSDGRPRVSRDLLNGLPRALPGAIAAVVTVGVVLTRPMNLWTVTLAVLAVVGLALYGADRVERAQMSSRHGLRAHRGHRVDTVSRVQIRTSRAELKARAWVALLSVLGTGLVGALGLYLFG